jgi:hypothetical protein
MRRIPALLIFCLWPTVVSAGAISSEYTKFDPATCKEISAPRPEEEWGGASLCKGYGGLKVYYGTGDLRDMLAYGTDPQHHCAATQTFGPFNAAQGTIEWRLNGGRPFAAIQRWKVSDPEDSEKTKSWLAVTRIEAHNSCRVAVVEGSMPDANVLARQAADQLAPSFSCETDEAKIISHDPTNGEGGTSGSPCAPPEQ